MPNGINKQLLAESYGFSAAMLNSNPELKRLFNKAVKENWAPDMFVARVRGTKWYKKTSETVRNAQVQKKSDPGTYKAQVDQQNARVTILARELGSQMPAKAIRKMAETAYQHGWDDNQLRRHLAASVRRTSAGLLEGQAGEWERQWREYAGSMGLSYTPYQYGTWARKATKGSMTPEDVLGLMQHAAKSRYPQFAGRIAKGESMDDIAQPYRQTIGELLEVDPASIPLSGRLLQKGLNQRTKKGDPTSMPLYKFEDVVRQDPRWRQTDNAKKSGDEMVRQLGTLFGKVAG